ncbi:MAG: hypothetical protein CMLOHMNK_00106 [Steroidobacteraceae bacterium]|nr:hypothetical protein [Steroidobacteraceae bacterium]
MLSLVRLFADIALLRRGPEDVPASALLLASVVVAYFLVSFFVSLLLPPFAGPWHLHLLVDVGFTLAWYVVLMRVFARPERFLQTTTAVFGYQTVLAPAWIATAWLAGRFQDNEVWLLPVAIAGLGMLAWVLVANARILRSALGLTMAACVGLAILQTIAGQLLLLGLFPPPAAS